MKYFVLCMTAFALLLTYTGCTDLCEDTTCLNGGVCVDGSCECADGYSGDSCEIADGSGVPTGWTGDDDPSTVPTHINTTNFGSSGSLPSSVDLVPHFPPIGNQGSFGTCVAWAVAYNLKTALEGIDNGWGSSELSSSTYQKSPKDLFTAIPDNQKGANCNGTNFETAMDMLLSRGAATMSTVPYENLGGCYQSNLQSSWTTEAADHKIENYRKINPTVADIKYYLANNSPVVLGAKLSDNFMSWNSDDVISYNTTYNVVGIHSYHAMIIAGYDDSKGAAGAFRVINSWGTNWGDWGYIWVDYNFMVNEFGYGGNYYVATNADSDGNPPVVDPTITNSPDLVPWVFSDVSTYGTSGYINERALDFNVYNIGDETCYSSSDWGIYYIYYDPWDANNYGLLLYDEINTTITAGTFNCPTYDHCIMNYDIPSGGDIADEIFGSGSILRTYYVPTSLTGYYYLVVYVDPLDAVEEMDEVNNYFYTSGQDPIYFNGGYAAKTGPGAFNFAADLTPNERNLESSKYNTAVTAKNRNAYSPKEINALIKLKKKSGDLDIKLQEYQARIAQEPGRVMMGK